MNYYFNPLLRVSFPLALFLGQLITLMAVTAASAQGSGAVNYESLLAQARGKKIWQERQWQALLHYVPASGPEGVKSTIDTAAFFLAPAGPTNPRAELEATLAAFAQPAAFTTNNATRNGQHPQCAYRARYEWLSEELDFAAAALPHYPCPEFDRWRQKIKAESVSLIFAAAYLNNPASLFGHTLLRFDNAATAAHTPLLSYSLSFAAITDDELGPRYALKGIFGGYDGRFSAVPYARDVALYSDGESRDIWEYRLKLGPAELQRLLAHVWELKDVDFNYYFFDENCSYQILALLEAASPDLRLTPQFPLWTVPAETIRALYRQPGLVRSVTYRPSRLTLMRERVRHLSTSELHLAQQLAMGARSSESDELARLDPLARARVLELAIEALLYQQESETGPHEASDARLMALLQARSVSETPPRVPVITPPKGPEQSHGDARATLGYGFEESHSYVQLGLRPLLHDLLDPPAGYTPGAQIEILDGAVRYYASDEGLQLHALTLIDILSIPPRTFTAQPYAWHARAALQRKRTAATTSTMTGEMTAGIGTSAFLGGEVTAACFLEAGIVLSDYLAETAAGKSGVELAIYYPLSEAWQLGLEAEGYFLTPAADIAGLSHIVSFSQSLRVTRESALQLVLATAQEFNYQSNSMQLNWHCYF